MHKLALVALIGLTGSAACFGAAAAIGGKEFGNGLDFSLFSDRPRCETVAGATATTRNLDWDGSDHVGLSVDGRIALRDAPLGGGHVVAALGDVDLPALALPHRLLFAGDDGGLAHGLGLARRVLEDAARGLFSGGAGGDLLLALGAPAGGASDREKGREGSQGCADGGQEGGRPRHWIYLQRGKPRGWGHTSAGDSLRCQPPARPGADVGRGAGRDAMASSG